MNRYDTLIDKALLVVDSSSCPNQTDQRYNPCRAPIILEQIFTVIANIVAAVFSALRIYGTWNRSWRPALPVLIVALVVPVSNIYQYSISLPASYAIWEPPLYGCGENIALDADQIAKLPSPWIYRG
ncbi:hypothetical protein AcW1_009742 [Taiwanofungus camphoratus]|nr:hypothetical protein AcW1_009742 [Antrodia cinnamomea]